MILKIKDCSQFVDGFLMPLSRVNNSCIIKYTSAGVSTLMSAADNTVILYGKYKTDLDVEEPSYLNIPDIGRLIKVLQCIKTPEVELDINSNNIKYKSDDLRFTYHLLDDGVLSHPPVNTDKIKQLKYNTTFTLPYSTLISVIKSASFTLNINKVYFSTNNGKVYAEISDHQAHNTDSICIKIGDEYSGQDIDEPLPINFETIRVLATSRCDLINVFINSELNVMTFEVNNNNTKMTYIVSGLMK